MCVFLHVSIYNTHQKLYSLGHVLLEVKKKRKALNPTFLSSNYIKLKSFKVKSIPRIIKVCEASHIFARCLASISFMSLLCQRTNYVL